MSSDKAKMYEERYIEWRKKMTKKMSEEEQEKIKGKIGQRKEKKRIFEDNASG